MKECNEVSKIQEDSNDKEKEIEEEMDNEMDFYEDKSIEELKQIKSELRQQKIEDLKEIRGKLTQDKPSQKVLKMQYLRRMMYISKCKNIIDYLYQPIDFCVYKILAKMKVFNI